MLRFVLCGLAVVAAIVHSAQAQVAQQPIAGELKQCTVLFFKSSQCQPCRQLEPLLIQLHNQGWDIRAVDAPNQLDVAQRYDIKNLPTLVMLSDGREVDRIVGVTSAEQLNSRLSRLAARHRSSGSSSPDRTQLDNTQSASIRQATAPSGPIVRGQSPSPLAAGFPMLAAGALDSHSRRAPKPEHGDRARKQGASVSSNAGSGNRSNAIVNNNNLQEAVARATDATVRIKTQESNTSAFGSGTIIAVHDREALVITCGHLFRDMQPGSRLTVDLFAGTPRQTTVLGELIDFQADEQDIAILSIQSPTMIQPVSILPRGETLQVGQPVFSLGCDHGNDPTRRDTKITHVNRYLGADNVEISGAPAVGRSGGGLFDAQGRLIGVCNAACSQDDEGIYAGAEVIYHQLARADQSHLFESLPKPNSPSSSQLAGQLASTNSPAAEGGYAEPSPAQAMELSWPDENPTLSGIATTAQPIVDNRSSQQPQVQLICVVRQPGGADRVVTINQPSKDLLEAIQQHSSK